MNMNDGPVIVIFEDPTEGDINVPGFEHYYKLVIAAQPPDPELVGANKYTAGWLAQERSNPYLYEAEDAPLYEGDNDLNTVITMAAELYHRCLERFRTGKRLDFPTRIYYLQV